jgi:hypothetical protein
MAFETDLLFFLFWMVLSKDLYGAASAHGGPVVFLVVQVVTFEVIISNFKQPQLSNVAAFLFSLFPRLSYVWISFACHDHLSRSLNQMSREGCRGNWVVNILMPMYKSM